MSAARYHVVVVAPESEARRFAATSSWAIDQQASESAPAGISVMRLDRTLADVDQLSHTGLALNRELSDRGLQPVGILANILGSDQVLGSAEQIWMQMWPHPFDSDDGEPIQVIIPGPGDGPGKPPAPDPTKTKKQATEGAGKADAEDPAKGKSTGGDAGCCEAGTIDAALGALADPSSVWPWAEEGERGELARALLPDLYANRAQLSERAAWLFASETVLLDRSSEENRSGLAEELLRTRGQLTDADARMRGSRADLVAKKVELQAKEVALAGKRVDLAEKGVSLAGEMLEHMKKWRSIAKWGVVFLVATTIFSMFAVGYVLLKLMPDKEVSDAAAPIIIFVLALFAISPAVLLLRERPLEGLDKWSPNGGSGSSGDQSGKQKDGGSSGGKAGA